MPLWFNTLYFSTKDAYKILQESLPIILSRYETVPWGSIPLIASLSYISTHSPWMPTLVQAINNIFNDEFLHSSRHIHSGDVNINVASRTTTSTASAWHFHSEEGCIFMETAKYWMQKRRFGLNLTLISLICT